MIAQTRGAVNAGRRARGQPGNRKPRVLAISVGADSISARFAAARTPAGGINPAPTNDFYVLIQPGTPPRRKRPREGRGPPLQTMANAQPNGTVITLRAAVGRGALTPPDPAAPQTPVGGYGIRPYSGFLALEACGVPGWRETHKTTVGRGALTPPDPQRGGRFSGRLAAPCLSPRQFPPPLAIFPGARYNKTM